MKFAWKTSTFVLFQEWSTSTTQGLASAMLLSCAMAVTYEYVRQLLGSRSRQRQRGQNKRNRAVFLLCQASLYAMSALVSNLLMLVLMTYNIWLFVSIVIGAGCGYFLTRPVFNQQQQQQQSSQRNRQDNNDNNTMYHKKIQKPVSGSSSSLHYYPLLSNGETQNTVSNSQTQLDEMDFVMERNNSTRSSTSTTEHLGVSASEKQTEAEGKKCENENNNGKMMETNHENLNVSSDKRSEVDYCKNNNGKIETDDEQNLIHNDDDIGVLFDSSPFKESRECLT